MILLPRPSFSIHSHRISSLSSKCSLPTLNISNMKFPRAPLLGQRHMYPSTRKMPLPKAGEKEPKSSLSVTVEDKEDPLTVFLTTLFISTFKVMDNVVEVKFTRKLTLSDIKGPFRILVSGVLLFISAKLVVRHRKRIALEFTKFRLGKKVELLQNELKDFDSKLTKFCVLLEGDTEETEKLKEKVLNTRNKLKEMMEQEKRSLELLNDLQENLK